MIFLLVIGVALCLLPVTVTRADPTDSVTISVGYFGTPYIEIADLNEDEMLERSIYRELVYSSIDKGGFTRYNLANGVELEPLLQSVGIETDDIAKIYFIGDDGEVNDEQTAATLFERRYYFPDLAANWDQEHLSAYEGTEDKINSTKQPVPTILAFEQSLARNWGEPYDDEKYRAKLSSEECLRVVFGQTVYNEETSHNSIYTVAAIQVMLDGSPVRANDAELEEYGASQKVSYRVSSGFAELNKWIEENLTFASSDSSVVEVDPHGNMTPQHPGVAYISIFYSDEEDAPIETIKVTVTKKETEGTGDTPGEGSSPDEDPTDVPEGQDEPDEPDKPDEPEEPEEPDDEEPDDEEPDADEPEDEKDIYPDTFGSDDGTGGEDSGAGLPSTEDSGINGDQTGSVESGETPDGGTTTGTSIMLPLWTDPAEQGSVNSEDTATALSTQLETIEEEKEQETVLMDTLGRIDLSSLPEEQREQIEELMEEARLDEETEEELLEEALLEVDAEEILTAEQMDTDSLSNVEGLDEGVYLAIGNVAGAGSVSGSGGKALEVEEWTNQETIILIISLAAMFAVGLIYRIVKFRKDTER